MARVEYIAPNVKARLERIAFGNKRQALQEWLSIEAGAMKQRTLAGKGPEGNQLAAYSPRYEKLRASRGFSTSVNLTLTGNMRNGIVTEISETPDAIVGQIKMNDTSSISPFGRSGKSVTARQKALWTNVKRPWFGVPKAAVKRLLDNLRKS